MVGAIVSDFVSKRVKFGTIVIGSIVLYVTFWLIGISYGGHFIIYLHF